MAIKYGVFLARMQPVHNAHLFLVEKAVEENEKVLIFPCCSSAFLYFE